MSESGTKIVLTESQRSAALDVMAAFNIDRAWTLDQALDEILEAINAV
jgi:hypothetical protein